MTRGRRYALWLGGGLLALMAVVLITAVIVVQTDWFRQFVRNKIIAVTEESTGGKVDIARFDFDWTHLRATITGFVLHGTEKPNEAPLFQAKTLTVELKILATFKQQVDLRALLVDVPQANVIVYPDGSTNVPAPKVKKPSDKSALETVVDLAVRRFELNNGSFTFAETKTPLNARGENLRAQLSYNLLKQAYEGQVALDPLLFGYQNNPPLKIHAELPLILEKDRITLKNAKITTPQSQVLIAAVLEDMRSPRTSGSLTVRLNVQEFATLAGLKVAQSPAFLEGHVELKMDKDRIDIPQGHFDLGQSKIDGSGTLKDPAGHATFALDALLAGGELGRLFRLQQIPEGNIRLATNATTTGNFDNVSLNPLKVEALGGKLDGRATLAALRNFVLEGNLSGFDTRALAKLAGKPLPYSGVVAGPVHVAADFKKPGTTGYDADVKLAIAPGRGGIPVSGRVFATYRGEADSIALRNSFIALPNTRVDLAGTLGSRINVKVASHDLRDLQPIADIPVTFDGGSMTLDAAVTGTLNEPRITGHLAATRFAVEGRAFDSLAADINATSAGASVRNAILQRGTMRADAAVDIGLRKWTAPPAAPLSATLTMRNADLADLLALAGQADIQASGSLSADAKIGGTIGNPQGSATLTARNGKLYDQPYDQVQAQVNLSDQLVTIPSATLTDGLSRIDLTASFQHPRDGFKTGRLQAHVKSNQVDLARFQHFIPQTPGLAGTANTNLDVTAELKDDKGKSEVDVTSVNGDFAIRGLQSDGQAYGDLTATVNTSGRTVAYRVDSNLAGSTVRVNGQTQLAPDYPTTADAAISNLPIERILALAGRKDIPVRGILSGKGNISGTLNAPTGSADLTLAKAVVYDEPLDRAHARINLTPLSIDLTEAELAQGQSRIAMNATYTHPAGDYMTGNIRFAVRDAAAQLADLKVVQKIRPGLAGAVKLVADGVADVKKGKEGAEVQLSKLNANLDASSLVVNRANLGEAHLVAQTSGDRLNFTLNSNVAQSKIEGSGSAELRDGYPVNAKLSFSNVTYAGLRPLLGMTSGPAPDFNALTEGQLTVQGPLTKLDELKGRLEITKLEASAAGRAATNNSPITIRNDGPIVVALDRAVMRIERAHITGPQTDINLSGTAPLQGATAMNLNVAANTNLGLLQQMSRDIYSAGTVNIQAQVRGTLSQPLINGRAELKNASFNMIDLPNGLSNANGVILFNGTSATIQTLTAESGGGKVNAGGFVGFGDGTLTYGLKLNANDVRVRYPEGASINAAANLSLTGTMEKSVLGGTVTLQQVGFSPRNDFGSMLSKTAAPVQAPSAPSGPLAGMRLDIHIRTAPTVSFQTALATKLQADADLRVRGTAASPGMTGRVNISEGELIFFGTKYTVNQGTVSFYSPYAIQPVLNIDLETVAKGVDVVLNISGPIDDMKLTYHSDPPLQFQELVSLLASGKTPTSDPTLLAQQGSAPAQSFQQMGESALVSQAIANPLSSRLQRVFGVNQLKIDPTFTSGSELPQARLTLQQQITNNVTFTYITNLTQANSQIVRVEWALNEQWSAIATREENGRFGVDVFYKKKFR